MNRSPSFAVLCTVLVLAGSGIVTVGMQPAAAAESPELDAPSATFQNSPVTVTRGGSAEIKVKHNRDAEVWLGGAGGALVGTVNGSGTSTVTIDTYNPEFSVENASLDVGEYQLSVTINGTEYDFGTLAVEERAPASVSVGTAAGWKYALGDGVETIRGNSRETTNATKGELVVVTFDVQRLQKAYEEQAKSNGTEESVMVWFRQKDPPMNQPDHVFEAINESQRNTSEVVMSTTFGDGKNGSMSFAWDTSDVRLGSDGRSTYNITLALGSENNYVEERTVEASVEVTVVEPRMTYQVSDQKLSPWETDISVSGQTNRAPGTTIEFWARNPGTYQNRKQVTVGANGTFSTSFNISEAPEGSHVEILPRLVLPKRTIPYTDKVTKIDVLEESATVVVEDQQTNGTQLTVRNLSMSLNGHVRVVDSIDRVVATQYVPAGEYTNQTIKLSQPLETSRRLTVTAHVDRNQSQTFDPKLDRPFQVNESQAVDSAVIHVSKPTTTQPETTTSGGTTEEPTADSERTTENEVPTYLTNSVEEPQPLTPVTKVSGDLSPLLSLLAFCLAVGVLMRRSDKNEK